MFCHFFRKIIVNCFLDNVGEGIFILVVALVESISVPLTTQATFLLLSVETNVIIMPSIFLYKEHLVIIFGYNWEYNTIVIIK